MRDTVDIARRFRSQLRNFRPSIKDNWWKRRALYLIRKWYCLITCQGEERTADITVTDEITLIRYPDLFATYTVIANTGAHTVTIFEDDVIVGIVQPGKSKTFRFTNRFIIDGKCDSGESTTLTVTTLRRCECGDTDPLPYGQTIEPVGGDLI